jgi:DNA-directed RNA polymerase subunit RPC12/RpoP
LIKLFLLGKEKVWIERARGICEYCKNQQELMVEEFEVDHIYPKALGGPTTLDNLALACPHCNGKKLTKIRGIDPLTGRHVALFNPRRQHWNRHSKLFFSFRKRKEKFDQKKRKIPFKWSDDKSFIIGKTLCGRATIEALQMNRPRIVRIRRLWRALGLHPPTQ